MKTEIIRIDARSIDMGKVRFAAEVIKNGGLVAFPTETVYGLGANAFDETAVKGIFEAKGRPSDNPLIVHIADKDKVKDLSAVIPPVSVMLMDAFWPGPLTLVMHKSPAVSPVITAGLDTVAVRMPVHPVALAFIKACGLPVAAPSANISGRPSPTRAEHVIEDLFGKVDVIIDGGNADVGLESTVLDVTVNPPMILRPGGVTAEQLESLLGGITVDPVLSIESTESTVPKSPGNKYTHYSPKARLIVVEGALEKVACEINRLVEVNILEGLNVGVLATDQTKHLYPGAKVISAGDRLSPETIASNLFNVLREFDRTDVQLILAEAVDDSGVGFAVMNRLSKAAGYNILRV